MKLIRITQYAAFYMFVPFPIVKTAKMVARHNTGRAKSTRFYYN